MAAVASLKQMPVKLPKIPVSHSGQVKSDNANELAVESTPVAPYVEPTQSRVSHSASLPFVRMSLNGSPTKQKPRMAVTRSLTSIGSNEASRGERSMLKSSWLKANDIKNPFKYTVEELHEIVQDKISSGFYGLKHLFKSHTANGNGLVSRLTLHHDQYVSFEMFISKFPDNEAVKKEWLKPIQKAKAAHEAISYPEQHYRNANTKRVVRNNIAPASFFMLFLKEFVKKRKFMPEFHMPEAVRNGKEEMLRVHLRRIITSLSGYDINELEMDKLWLRFDTRGVGSVPCEDFYKIIGYSTVVDTSLIPLRPCSQLTPPNKQSSEEKCRPATDMGVVSFYEINEDKATVANPSLPVKRTNKIAKKLKRLNSVIEELIYNLSLPAVNLEAAFKEFDILSDNFVSKVDFRRVLSQFGFPIGALDLETFLARTNLRVMNDLIEYKEFIQRFTNREDFGMVNKVVNDSQHLFNRRPGERLTKEGSGIEGWSAEELEAGLVEHFMGSYIQLLLSLRNLDPKMTRLLSEEEVRPLLEKILGREFQRGEWKYLLSMVGLSKEGLIPYENVIAIINNRRPTWNETNKLGHQVIVIQRPATTVELERLRESKEETMRTHISPLDHLRSLDDMSVAIRELLKTRFQALDYAYRLQDRKMTGRLDKVMLGRILKECGLDFQPKEMDKLWGTFALAPDGLYTWGKFCQRYVSDTGKLQQASELDTLTSAEDMKQVAGRPLASQAASRASTRAKLTDPVLIKLRPQILNHYEPVEALFHSLDSQGRGHVTVDEAIEAFKVLKIQISAEEKHHLLQLFDLEQSSKFHYKPFLAVYKPRSSSRQCATTGSVKQPAAAVRPSTRMLNNRLVQQLQGRVPEMRRQFKKSDPLGQGVLSMTDFRACLEQLGVTCGGDDGFSEVTSLFDHSLKGQINYEEFSSLCR
ncbi:EF-hand calcium-binding domain-containing protein 6-like [Watersipora subatra]|uniref:EF-hand calcium-binding domain-containing protein 6-like n=1 Tax=Watersipora subatra TaxID=2589382 RepID=UPI00355B77DE